MNNSEIHLKMVKESYIIWKERTLVKNFAKLPMWVWTFSSLPTSNCVYSAFFFGLDLLKLPHSTPVISQFVNSNTKKVGDSFRIIKRWRYREREREGPPPSTKDRWMISFYSYLQMSLNFFCPNIMIWWVEGFTSKNKRCIEGQEKIIVATLFFSFLFLAE